MKKPNIIWINSSFIDDRINSNHYKEKMLTNIENILNSGLDILKINDIVEVNRRGKGLSVLKDGEIPNYKVRNLTNYGIDEEPDYVSKEDFIKNKSCHIKKGDVLLASTGVGSLGKVDLFYGNFPATVDGHITILRTKENFDSGYLKAYLQSKYGQIMIEQNTLGSTGQTELYPKDIEKFLIPIPSPEIQKYIGDKVRKAEELREEAKRLKKEAEEIVYKELNISFLENKFKDLNNKYTWVGPSNLEIRVDSKYYDEKVLKIKNYFNKHYDTLKLKDCLQYCAKGKSFVQNCEEGIILIKTKNLNNLIINYEENFVCEKEVNNNLILKEKDLIFASMGVGSLGKIDMYYPIKEKSTIDGTLTLLRFKNDCKLKPEYVMEFIRTQIGQKLVYQNVVGSTGIISISVEDLINIDIPFIEVEKQEKISKNVNKYLTNLYTSKQLIQEAKQDVEDLIEGNIDMSKVKANS